MKYHIQDASGHSTVEFSPEDKAKAEQKFKELLGLGFTPARREGQGKLTVNREFDPTVEETVFVPPLVGG